MNEGKRGGILPNAIVAVQVLAAVYVGWMAYSAATWNSSENFAALLLFLAGGPIAIGQVLGSLLVFAASMRFERKRRRGVLAVSILCAVFSATLVLWLAWPG